MAKSEILLLSDDSAVSCSLVNASFGKATAVISVKSHNNQAIQIELPLNYFNKSKLNAHKSKGEQESSDISPQSEQLENILNQLFNSQRRSSWTPKEVLREFNINQENEILNIVSVNEFSSGDVKWMDCIINNPTAEISFSRVVATVWASLPENLQTSFTLEDVERLSIRYRVFFFDKDCKNGIGKHKCYFAVLPNLLVTVRAETSLSDDGFNKIFSEVTDIFQNSSESNESNNLNTSSNLLATLLLKLEQFQDAFWMRLKIKCERLEKERISHPLSNGDKKEFLNLKEAFIWFKRKLDRLESDLTQVEESLANFDESSVNTFEKFRKKINYRLKIYSASKDLLRSIDDANLKADQEASRKLTDGYRRIGMMFIPLTLTQTILIESHAKSIAYWASGIWAAGYGILWLLQTGKFDTKRHDEKVFKISRS